MVLCRDRGVEMTHDMFAKLFLSLNSPGALELRSYLPDIRASMKHCINHWSI